MTKFHLPQDSFFIIMTFGPSTSSIAMIFFCSLLRVSDESHLAYQLKYGADA